jgi:hypothetical protein
MTTSIPVRGDSAQAVTTSVSSTTIGRVAFNGYLFASAAAAQAAGFNVEAGPALPVYVVSAAELAAGTFIVEGDPMATPLYPAPAGMPIAGQNPIPVVIVNAP